jgi:hypothetical protein
MSWAEVFRELGRNVLRVGPKCSANLAEVSCELGRSVQPMKSSNNGIFQNFQKKKKVMEKNSQTHISRNRLHKFYI